MRVLTVVHQDDAGPGVFEAVLAELGAAAAVWRPAYEPAPPATERWDAAVVLGGAMHVDQEDVHPWLGAEKRLLAGLLEQRTPVLGVCLGAQLLAEAAGGGARPAAGRPEIGWREITLGAAGRADPLLGSLPARFEAFEWHSYELYLPPGVEEELAASGCCLQAFRAGERAWGIQFHAEVTRDIVAGWIDKDGASGELRSEGIAGARLLAETEARIEAWNELGRRLCRRFLELASVPG